MTKRVAAGINPSGTLVVLGVIGLWQLLVSTKAINFEFVPTPGEVATALVDLTKSGALPSDALHTLWVVVVASILGITIGALLGSALGLLKPLHTYSMASFDFLRTLPIVALMPVALLIWGPTAQTEIITAAYDATWVVVVTCAGAFRSINARLDDVVMTFQLSRMQALRKVWIPSIMPAVLVGSRLAVVSAMIVAILAETLVNPEGLGWGMIQAQQALQPADLWAYAVATGFFGYLLNLVLVQGVRWLSPGGRVDPALNGA